MDTSGNFPRYEIHAHETASTTIIDPNACESKKTPQERLETLLRACQEAETCKLNDTWTNGLLKRYIAEMCELIKDEGIPKTTRVTACQIIASCKTPANGDQRNTAIEILYSLGDKPSAPLSTPTKETYAGFHTPAA